jgi:hypothetical protein
LVAVFVLIRDPPVEVLSAEETTEQPYRSLWPEVRLVVMANANVTD